VLKQQGGWRGALALISQSFPSTVICQNFWPGTSSVVVVAMVAAVSSKTYSEVAGRVPSSAQKKMSQQKMRLLTCFAQLHEQISRLPRSFRKQ
jgi:tRNA A37 threonylcarbamoyladenosine synthetase subunit TsaC/SUA5/YrdC